MNYRDEERKMLETGKPRKEIGHSGNWALFVPLESITERKKTNMEIKYRSQAVDLMKELALPLVAAELGVAEGNFSRDLLVSGIEKLYSIDNWANISGQKGDGGHPDSWHQKNYDSAMEKFKPFADKSIVLRGMSYDMAKEIPDNTLGLVNVDCDHSFNGCMRDITTYWPKLVSGGIMVFHDYENQMYGVKEAVKQFADANGLEIHLIPENKPEDAGAWIQKP